jgi:ABC-type transport system involved in multi-copper enzyme maturation permease subunit
MTASTFVNGDARSASRFTLAGRLAGVRPLIRKDIAEWAHGYRAWVILGIATVFTTLNAANAAIIAWLVANVPDGVVPPTPLDMDPASNLVTASAAQIFVLAAIFTAMSLLVMERERGTLAWVASMPVSRGAIWVATWVVATVVVGLAGGLVPLALATALVTVLYGAVPVGIVVAIAIGTIASVALFLAVGLAASVFVPSQPAVAAIGFAALLLPQVFAALLPIDIAPFLPTSVFHWTVGLAMGAEVGFVTPVAWAVSVVALVVIAIRGMGKLEL